MENLAGSFPQKSPGELNEIAAKFYHHLCDLIVESIKLFTISSQDIHDRMKCRNPEVVNRFFDEGKSIIMAGGHFNNWELFAVAIDELIKHKSIGIYKPLTNKYFDAKMQSTRSRYGLKMISTKKVAASFESEMNQVTATIFAIDQSPSNPERCHWMTFLNRDTAVLTGAERYARQYDYPVVFGRLHKTKRGFYELEFELACEKPSETRDGEITERITRMLEKDIIVKPEYWLWSHKRWKHRRTPAGN